MWRGSPNAFWKFLLTDSFSHDRAVTRGSVNGPETGPAFHLVGA
jgi:hypothetical protein